MLDVRLLRENPDAIKKDLRKRGWLDKLPLVDEGIAADVEWRQAKKRVDDLRHSQNQVTAEIASLKRAGQDPKEKLAEVKGIPEEIARVEKSADKLQARVREILMSLPNILHESVPTGPDEGGNVTVKTWGAPRKFDFEPKDHVDLLSELGLVDVERAAKISGARLFFREGDDR